MICYNLCLIGYLSGWCFVFLVCFFGGLSGMVCCVSLFDCCLLDCYWLVEVCCFVCFVLFGSFVWLLFIWMFCLIWWICRLRCWCYRFGLCCCFCLILFVCCLCYCLSFLAEFD